MASVKESVLAAGEEYLVSLSNKGLYNRSLRELEKASPGVALSEGRLEASFADGAEVLIEGELAKAACSCPSRGVCKHVLMAILAAQQHAPALESQAAPQGEEGEASDPFDWLYSLSSDDLKKKAGKARWREARALAQKGGSAHVSGSSIAAEGDGWRAVLLSTGLDDASCSCRESGFCRHKAAACLIAIREAKGAFPAGSEPDEEALPAPAGAGEAIARIRALASETLFAGIARMPSDLPMRYAEAAALCHAARLANLERLAQRASGLAESCLRRSAAFQREAFASALSQILSAAALAEKGDKAAIGAFRDAYEDAGDFEALGIGAFGWVSQGGYKGVTTLFYAPEWDRVVRYTVSMPSSSAQPISSLYTGPAPWGLGAQLSSLSRSAFLLRSPKLNASGSLSSTQGCTAEAIGPSGLSGKLSPIDFSAFRMAAKAVWEKRPGGRLVALLRPKEVGAPLFDDATQTLEIPLADAEGGRAFLKAKYAETEDLLFENLYLAAEEGKKKPGAYLAECFFERGRLVAFPIAHYGERFANLSLDRPDPALKRPKFNWGFKK